MSNNAGGGFESIINQTAELVGSVKESPVYTEFISSRDALYKNPEYVKMLQTYLRLRSEGLSADDISLGRRMLESNEYYRLTANEDIRRYMDAARGITDLTCGIIDIIAVLCPIDTFTDEEPEKEDNGGVL